MADIDGELHPAVDGQSLDEDEDGHSERKRERRVGGGEQTERHRQTNRQTDGQADRETERDIQRETHTHRDTHTHGEGQVEGGGKGGGGGVSFGQLQLKPRLEGTKRCG